MEERLDSTPLHIRLHHTYLPAGLSRGSHATP